MYFAIHLERNVFGDIREITCILGFAEILLFGGIISNCINYFHIKGITTNNIVC